MSETTSSIFNHTTTTTTTILYLTTLHLGAKKRSLKHVRAKTMYTINTLQNPVCIAKWRLGD